MNTQLTLEQIQQWAREAGFRQCHGGPNEWWTYTDSIERFAILARADLVAENITLKTVVNGQVEAYSELKEQYDAMPGYFNSVMAERDKLRTELETLRAEATAWHVSYDNLKADAERYRWMRDKTFTSDWNVLAYKAVDYVDSYIDAAMKGTPG